MKHAVLLVAITGLAFAQTKFVDNSPAESPLSLAGSTQSGMCVVKAHNNDARPAVAVVVDFDDGSVVSYRMTHDHFFRSDDHVAMHGTDFEMDFQCDAKAKVVTMTTKLVQFDDGQLWKGSAPQTIKWAAAQRREEMDYQNEVLAAPDVKAELSKAPHTTQWVDGKPVTGRLTMWQMMNDKENFPDPIAAAKDRLANADAHASWLLNLK